MSHGLILQRKLCSLQSFSEEFQKKAVTEWMVAYIDYEAVKECWVFLCNCFDCYHKLIFKKHQRWVQIIPVDPEVKMQIEKAMERTQLLLEEGEKKAKKFVKWKLTQILYYWQQVIDVTISHEMVQNLTHANYDKKRYLKQLIQLVYANTTSLKEFIDLNARIREHWAEIKKDYAEPLLEWSQEEENLEQQSNKSIKAKSEMQLESPCQSEKKESLIKSDFEKYTNYLNAIDREATNLFYSPIYYSEGAEEEISDFARIPTDKEMSGNSYFLFGLYVGLGVVILVMLVLLLLLNLLVIDEDETLIDDMKYIFPMFRGVGLLILYLWGVAWNVYGFIKYKINFKLVLKYGAHYSSPFQIMKRAGFFTLLFSLTLFLYLAGVQAEETSRVNLPLEYSPFLVWVVFFAYIFFPSQEMFNPKGRIYFYAILKSMLLSPLVKMGFVLSFATDQAVSFVTSIKDFAYTVCFYGSDFTVEQVSNCLKSDSLNGIVTGYVAALLPLLIRLVQCYRTAYQNSDLFWGDLQMWNFFKYVSSILTSTLSFLNSLYPSMFIPFLISSVISTSYSYYWDLRYDWGLLEPDSKHFLLRNTLSYKRPSLYYIAIGINLIFRCSWTLTISPSVLVLIPKSTFLPFLTGFIEILRRCMWNFFRIQKEHVTNCKQFVIAKENPDKLVDKVHAETFNREYSGDRETVVQYTRVADNQYIEHLKATVCKDLPKIERVDIDKAKEEFQRCCAELEEDEVKNREIYHISTSTGIKRDYYDI